MCQDAFGFNSRIEDDYMEKEIDLRRLVIKAFHITEVDEGGEK